MVTIIIAFSGPLCVVFFFFFGYSIHLFVKLISDIYFTVCTFSMLTHTFLT